MSGGEWRLEIPWDVNVATTCRDDLGTVEAEPFEVGRDDADVLTGEQQRRNGCLGLQALDEFHDESMDTA